MLTPEDNEAITHVGPGTLMGNFLREYWLPAMLSSELPEPDCNPVRVRMLGEDLIGFRDTVGRVGLIANLCPHRGASMFFGRNEDNGLRCLYHAWKFDVNGKCVDMPNEPPTSNFKDRVHATAYPTQERAGMVFVYMGTREVPPPLPGIEALQTPHASVTVDQIKCNWLQSLEGNIDTVHASFLHYGSHEPEWYPEGSLDSYGIKQRWAEFVAADTDYGAIYGAKRSGPPGYDYWRIGQFLFPLWTNPAAGLMGHKITALAWVPMDDTHTLQFNIHGYVSDSEESTIRSGAERLLSGQKPTNTSGWYGRFEMTYDMENDFFIDREQQRELGSFTGFPNRELAEDTGIQMSMGPILPREIEHLGTSDLMVIRVRQRLLEAARAFAEFKTAPPALDTPEVYATRCGGAFLPEGSDWLEATEELRKPFIDHGPEINALAPGAFASGVITAEGFRPHKRPGALF
jgi:phthalate 4,5-dioxygenase